MPSTRAMSIPHAPSLPRAVALVAAGPLLLALWGYFLSIRAHGPWGTQVFSSYWASGRALATGANPYSWLPETYSGYVDGKLVGDINLNPPVFLPICQLFAQAPMMLGAFGFIAVSALLYVALVWMLADRTDAPAWKMGWALLLPPMVDTVAMGQNYILLFVLALTAWRLLTLGRLTRSAVAVGLLIAFKPNFALALPALLLAGHPRYAIVAGLAAAGASLLPVLLYGPEIYGQWLHALAEPPRLGRPMATALPILLRKFELPVWGLGLGAGVYLAALWMVWRRRPALAMALPAGYALGLVCAPLAWFNYALVLVPSLMAVRWNRPVAAGALMLLVPVEWLGRPGPDQPLLAAAAWSYFPLAVALVFVGLLCERQIDPDHVALGAGHRADDAEQADR